MKWDRLLVTTWRGITNWVRQESAAATALVQAFIALGIAFTWWHWSNAQTGTVIGIVSALLGMFVRSQVTPIARTRQPKRATVTGPPPGPPPAGGQPGGAPGFQTGGPDWPPTDPPGGPGTRPL